ncbi:MAG: Mrp/NBP35 family ATP-binding protein [Oscillospiraceae bacterium]|nr:Mrp/NBP35 family ATP-binding protein [Oscillospiraceae bacterium]
MSECTHDCSTCGEACASRQPEDMHEKPHELSKIGKVIAVVSGKGGVGKSLVTALTAVSVKRTGHTVGVLDADITGPSIPKMFGITGQAEADNQGIYPRQSKLGTDVMSVNLLLENPSDPVIWRGPVIAGAVKQFWTDVIWGDDDYLFVDMPPGTGDVPLTVFQSIPVDGILIVTTPQELVSMIVEKAVKMAETMNIPILGLIENMSYAVCPDCGKKINVFGESNIEEIATTHHLPVLGKIPMNPKLAGACDAGLVELFEGDWLEPAVDAILKLGEVSVQ